MEDNFTPVKKKKAVRDNQFPTYSHVIVVMFFNFSQALLESTAQHISGKNLPILTIGLFGKKKKKGTVLNWILKNK